MNDMRRMITICEGKTVLNSNFVKWFGNSKVVDANGKPLVVYHGSNAHAYVDGEIDIFNTLPPSGRGAAFFSSSKSLAGEYGEKVYGVYLRIENPLIVFGDGKNWGSLDHTTKIDGKVTDRLRMYHRNRAKEIDNIFTELTGDTSASPSKIPDETNDLRRFGLGIMPDMEYSSFMDTDSIVKQARRMGYDGVIFREINDSPTQDKNLYKNGLTDVYAVFRPHNIKSVSNDGSWDQNDPSINS